MFDSSSFDDSAASVTDQLMTVINAPVPFLLVISVVAAAMWKYLGHHYHGRIAAKDDLLALKQAQVDDYKDKLGGASPDAAKARMDALEARIDEIVPKLEAIRPRQVTSEQRQAMVLKLDKCQGTQVFITSDAASSEAAQLSRGLVEAFNSAKWAVRTPMVMGLGNPPSTGIALMAADIHNLSEEEACVADALNAARLEFDLQLGGPHPVLPGTKVVELILSTRLRS